MLTIKIAFLHHKAIFSPLRCFPLLLHQQHLPAFLRPVNIDHLIIYTPVKVLLQHWRSYSSILNAYWFTVIICGMKKKQGTSLHP